MAIFGPGLMLDGTTMRPVAGRVLQVRDPQTDAPVGTVAPVVTNTFGYYGQFETVTADQHVYLRSGTHVQHAVAVGAILSAVGGSDVVELTGTVPTSASLPTEATDGTAYIAEDTLHLWARVSGEWTDLGTVQGPAGSDAEVTAANVDPLIDARTGTGKRPVGRDEIVINVLDHGVAGDGITDDTAALQALFDSASTFNAPIYLPAGTYRVSGSGFPLKLFGKNRVIRGAGPATVIRATPGSGDGTVLAVSGATVSDLAIDGAFDPETATANLLSVLNAGDDVTVERCSIYDAQGSCVTITGQRVVVRGNTLQRFGDHAVYAAGNIATAAPYDIESEAAEIVIGGNVMRDDPTYHNVAGDPVRGTIKLRNNVAGVAITGNVVHGDQCVLVSGDDRRIEANPRRVVISGNILVASHSGVSLHTDLFAGAGATGLWVEDVTVTGNAVYSVPGSGSRGILFTRSRGHVVDNDFRVETTAVEGLHGTDNGASHITGNRIRGGTTGVAFMGTGSLVSGNTISGGTGRGVWMTRRNDVLGNLIRGGWQHGVLSEFVVAAGAAAPTVQGNTFEGNTFGASFTGAGVYGNTISNVFVGNSSNPIYTTHGADFNRGACAGNVLASGGAWRATGATDGVAMLYGPREPAVSALPAATASMRGRIARVEGGAGVADQVYICRKSASDAYEWAPLA